MSLTSALSDINLVAVLAAAAVHMVTGLIWFAPRLFGRAWVELTGKDLEPARRWLAAGVLADLATAFVLAILVRLAGATTIAGGIIVALLVWAGSVVTLEIGELIWEKIPFRLFAIRIGDHLVALSAAGAIVAGWQ